MGEMENYKRIRESCGKRRIVHKTENVGTLKTTKAALCKQKQM